MGRREKQPDRQQYFITQGKNKAFFRIYRDLFESEQFLKLSPKAQLLYIEFGLAAGQNAEFTFPLSAYRKRFSKDGFHKAKQQLIDAGFIAEVRRYKTHANVYKLSDAWKQPP